MTNVYIKHPDFAWVPAVLLDQDGDKARVSVPQYPSEQLILSDGGKGAKGKFKEQTINLKDYPHKVLPLQNVDANGMLVECADMVKLPYLHEVSSSIGPWTFAVFFIVNDAHANPSTARTGWYSLQS
jgi:hypothetical protein